MKKKKARELCFYEKEKVKIIRQILCDTFYSNIFSSYNLCFNLDKTIFYYMSVFLSTTFILSVAKQCDFTQIIQKTCCQILFKYSTSIQCTYSNFI